MSTQSAGRRRRIAPQGLALTTMVPLSGWQGSASIAEDTLRAVQVIWFAAALEHALVFAAVDRLAELFQAGMLPLRNGPAGALLVEYRHDRAERLSELDRRRVYSRVLGIGGPAGGRVPNRNLPALWVALVGEVHAAGASSLRTALIKRARVRDAARALAGNLARYGAGSARPAAALHEHIHQALALLADPEVRRAYGARDIWQLVDRIAAQSLGGARNAARFRTLANAGSTIIGWLARHAGTLNGSPASSPSPRPFPTDADLVSAIEAWLAASATDTDDDEDDD